MKVVLKALKVIMIMIGCMMVGANLLTAQEVGQNSIKKDVIYGRAGGLDLTCDILQPDQGKGPFPAILFFHGGGWQAGDKSHGHHWLRSFAKSGYVGISVGYRFAPEYPWPAQVLDAKAAVRYVRANAEPLQIDPNRIGVMGESAGGYLALMIGMTEDGDEFEENDGSKEYSSTVQAVVAYFSATDFTLPRPILQDDIKESVMAYYGKTLDAVMADFMGTATPTPALLKKMSVVTYVDGHDPPCQIFQGDADPFVSVSQALKLDQALTQANVRHDLIIVPGGGHGWTGKLAEETTAQMMKFFENELGSQ